MDPDVQASLQDLQDQFLASDRKFAGTLPTADFTLVLLRNGSSQAQTAALASEFGAPGRPWEADYVSLLRHLTRLATGQEASDHEEEGTDNGGGGCRYEAPRQPPPLRRSASSGSGGGGRSSLGPRGARSHSASPPFEDYYGAKDHSSCGNDTANSSNGASPASPPPRFQCPPPPHHMYATRGGSTSSSSSGSGAAGRRPRRSQSQSPVLILSSQQRLSPLASRDTAVGHSSSSPPPPPSSEARQRRAAPSLAFVAEALRAARAVEGSRSRSSTASGGGHAVMERLSSSASVSPPPPAFGSARQVLFATTPSPSPPQPLVKSPPTAPASTITTTGGGEGLRLRPPPPLPTATNSGSNDDGNQRPQPSAATVAAPSSLSLKQVFAIIGNNGSSGSGRAATTSSSPLLPLSAVVSAFAHRRLGVAPEELEALADALDLEAAQTATGGISGASRCSCCNSTAVGDPLLTLADFCLVVSRLRPAQIQRIKRAGVWLSGDTTSAAAAAATPSYVPPPPHAGLPNRNRSPTLSLYGGNNSRPETPAPASESGDDDDDSSYVSVSPFKQGERPEDNGNCAAGPLPREGNRMGEDGLFRYSHSERRRIQYDDDETSPSAARQEAPASSSAAFLSSPPRLSLPQARREKDHQQQQQQHSPPPPLPDGNADAFYTARRSLSRSTDREERQRQRDDDERLLARLEREFADKYGGLLGAQRRQTGGSNGTAAATASFQGAPGRTPLPLQQSPPSPAPSPSPSAGQRPALSPPQQHPLYLSPKARETQRLRSRAADYAESVRLRNAAAIAQERAEREGREERRAALEAARVPLRVDIHDPVAEVVAKRPRRRPRAPAPRAPLSPTPTTVSSPPAPQWIRLSLDASARTTVDGGEPRPFSPSASSLPSRGRATMVRSAPTSRCSSAVDTPAGSPRVSLLADEEEDGDKRPTVEAPPPLCHHNRRAMAQLRSPARAYASAAAAATVVNLCLSVTEKGVGAATAAAATDTALPAEFRRKLKGRVSAFLSACTRLDRQQRGFLSCADFAKAVDAAVPALSDTDIDALLQWALSVSDTYSDEEEEEEGSDTRGEGRAATTLTTIPYVRLLGDLVASAVAAANAAQPVAAPSEGGVSPPVKRAMRRPAVLPPPSPSPSSPPPPSSPDRALDSQLRELRRSGQEGRRQLRHHLHAELARAMAAFNNGNSVRDDSGNATAAKGSGSAMCDFFFDRYDDSRAGYLEEPRLREALGRLLAGGGDKSGNSSSGRPAASSWLVEQCVMIARAPFIHEIAAAAAESATSTQAAAVAPPPSPPETVAERDARERVRRLPPLLWHVMCDYRYLVEDLDL